MRENRPSGSEGGVAFGPSLPLSGARSPRPAWFVSRGLGCGPALGFAKPTVVSLWPGARVSSPAARRDGDGWGNAQPPGVVWHAAGEDTRAPGARSPRPAWFVSRGLGCGPVLGFAKPTVVSLWPGARVSSPAARRDGDGRWNAQPPGVVWHAAGEDTRARALGKAHTPKGASPFLAVLPARQRKETASWRSGRGEQLEVNG